jgi:hypothetical protein
MEVGLVSEAHSASARLCSLGGRFMSRETIGCGRKMPQEAFVDDRMRPGARPELNGVRSGLTRPQIDRAKR